MSNGGGGGGGAAKAAFFGLLSLISVTFGLIIFLFFFNLIPDEVRTEIITAVGAAITAILRKIPPLLDQILPG